MSKSELHSRDRYEETSKIPAKPPGKNDAKIFIIVVAIIIFIAIPLFAIFVLK